MGLNLEVEIDNKAGFCFGVVYAVEMAEDILRKEKTLYCLGDIVHNDKEVDRLEKKGLKIINREQLKELQNTSVLIRAHGEPPDTYKLAIENNLSLIDASCPVVLKLQNRIRKSYGDKKAIFIYGQHGHAEVEGSAGQTLGDAIVFEKIEELDKIDLPDSFTLYSQTTKSIEKFYSIYQELESRGYEVELNDTVCRQVSNRDNELKNFAQRFDVILFVAGKKSSNGKVLYEVCRKYNPRTYFISEPEEVETNFFKSKERVGISGATSTPLWLMENMKDRVLSL